MRRCILLISILLICLSGVYGGDILNTLAREMREEMKILKKKELPPYYISFRVDESYKKSMNSSLGSRTHVTQDHQAVLTVMVRVGLPEFDNYHQVREDVSVYYGQSSKGVQIPLDHDASALRHIIRRQVEKAYISAVEDYSRAVSNVSLNVKEKERSGDYTLPRPAVYREDIWSSPEAADKQWYSVLQNASALFLRAPMAVMGRLELTAERQNRYFVDTAGSRIRTAREYAQLIAEATAKAEDGMVLPVYHTWTEINMSALPEPEKIYEKIGDLADLLNRLCSAPFGEPYSGPVIMSGEASGVFFHEIFGHRTEGQRMKKADDGQTFKSMVGKEVLPGSFTVYCDPVLEHYDGSFLWGSYLYDDEGVKGEKTILVENGRLKEFLMSRTPMELFGASNGHGRAAPGRDPVARQSNLVVSSDVTVTEGEMILRFKKMLKVKGLSYGYYIESVTGGFTQTGRYKPNAFNVIPTVVYRIYADERPRELVRGIDLIGTPLSIFSHIEAAGNDTGIFTGYCGAESGMVPVTCVSPSLLVREIEFQKKKLSQSKRPVLSRPDTRDKEKP